MKNPDKSVRFKMFLLLIVVAFFRAVLWAQDNPQSTTTTNTHTETSSTGNEWYTSPLVWIIGGAVFILLLVNLTRGRRSGDGHASQVTVTKTVRKDAGGDSV